MREDLLASSGRVSKTVVQKQRIASHTLLHGFRHLPAARRALEKTAEWPVVNR
jgi:hypothetical protein